MTTQQFRVTLGTSCTIDVCGDYTPMQALQAARDATEGCFSGRETPKVLLCKADARGNWVAFEDVTPAERGTRAFRIAAIRRFFDDVGASADSDWISHCLDTLQGSIGAVAGLQVAKAAGFDLS